MPRPTLAARGESPAAFDRRCIPPWATLGVVHAGSNIPGILPPRALPWATAALIQRGLGATRDFHHGLLALAAVLALAGAAGPRAQMASGDQSETFAPNLFGGLEYRMVGPSRGGRATAVAGHREQPSTFYMGARQDAVNRYQELNSLLSDHIGRLELRTSNSRGGH